MTAETLLTVAVVLIALSQVTITAMYFQGLVNTHRTNKEARRRHEERHAQDMAIRGKQLQALDAQISAARTVEEMQDMAAVEHEEWQRQRAEHYRQQELEVAE
jgi:hypothetical protein